MGNITKENMTKALASVDPAEVVEGMRELGGLAVIMSDGDVEDPLNAQILRIATHPGFETKIRQLAQESRANPEIIMFSVLAGLMVGLLTPVSLDHDSL